MNAVVSLLLAKVKNEPAVVVGLLVSALVFVAGHFGVVLDGASLKEVLTPVVVGILTRRFVVPSGRHAELQALVDQDAK